MTTIAEEKSRREAELKNAPNMVVITRLKVIEAVQLAMEVKALTDNGLSNPYHEISLFYGKQRSVLRGLTADDVLSFDLPDTVSWNHDPDFTFPVVTRFGYEFLDTNGQPAVIDDPALYYLTRKKSTNVLSTIEHDSNAFAVPVQLKDQQQNIVNWGATIFNLTLSQLPQAGTVKISRMMDDIALDDGAGSITGTGISGTVDYSTGAVSLAFADPVSQSELLYAVYNTNSDPVVENNRDRIEPLNHSTNFHCVLSKKVIAGTLKVKVDSIDVAVDDGAGDISGTGLSGTINYETNSLQLYFTVAEDRNKLITVVHDSFTNETAFHEDYAQVDFTLDSNDYLPGHTLNLIDIAPGVLDQRPKIETTTLLRRKKDHQVVGTIKIICEGMETNSGWDHLTGNAEDTTVLTHNEFKSLLGFLDMDLVNPENNNDLQNGANSYISSSGRRIGSNSYPDIEKNPFWPCTDGTYLGSMIHKGHFVHTEEGEHKWATHNDIKWRYGTRPAGYNPTTFATSGSTNQNNPNTVIGALEAIRDFSGAGPVAVPPDSGNDLTGGTDYEMVGNYVYEYPYIANTPGPPDFVKGSGSEFTCYYNSAQHLIDDHLNHLLSQCDLLIALGDTTNTAETGKQAGDTQFFNNATAFRTALNSFLTYHNGFDPLSRAAYDTSQMTALKAATDPGAYLGQAIARLSELDTILGDPETAGSYSKIIYDACNYAANKDIGYLRDVIDKFNSIQDIYDMITQKQQQYAMYQDIYP